MTGWSLPLFKACVCDEDREHGRRRPDGLGPQPVGQAFDVHSEGQELCRIPAPLPKARGFLTYSSAPDQPLLGVPIREESLWHLSTQDRFEPVTFSLYVNGFAFCTSDGLEVSISLSPFSLVRNCRFQSGECSRLKSFKVSPQEPDPCCYFAVRNSSEREAEEERSEWVLGLSHTILLITDSLLPPFSVTCEPVPGEPRTARRLMAGYLIHRDDATSISVLFCELQAHSGASARMVLYENELCESPIMDILIAESSVCCDVVGINCSCFIVDSHHFASQTPSERKLWLRALSNIKVKIQSQAADPTEEELQHYRASIRENIAALSATLEPPIVSHPLLTRCARRTLRPVGQGDVELPSLPSTDSVDAAAGAKAPVSL